MVPASWPTDAHAPKDANSLASPQRSSLRRNPSAGTNRREMTSVTSKPQRFAATDATTTHNTRVLTPNSNTNNSPIRSSSVHSVIKFDSTNFWRTYKPNPNGVSGSWTAARSTISPIMIRASHSRSGATSRTRSTYHANADPAASISNAAPSSSGTIVETICVTRRSSPFAYASTTYRPRPPVRTVATNGTSTITAASTG